MPTAIKVCGVARVEDALAAAHHGAHAIGLVFYRPSPRYVAPALAREIIRTLPPFVTAVGLFVDATEAEVRETIALAPVGLLQFHGSESPVFCRQFRLPYIKAVRVNAGTDLLQYARDYHDAKALLLDAFVEGAHGGTGQSFDWGLIPRTLPVPVVLSGGLDARNVAGAIQQVRPWAVDVSSGVESAPGIKDAGKIAAFVSGVRNADV
jgi:phosphoribosylanthranilate isomerase